MYVNKALNNIDIEYFQFNQKSVSAKILVLTFLDIIVLFENVVVVFHSAFVGFVHKYVHHQISLV